MIDTDPYARSDMNRLHNCGNPHQGDYVRTLCVCSAGLLRSPTAALVLSRPPFNRNTRAAGVHGYALVPLDRVLLTWAQEIVCMEIEHEHIIRQRLKEANLDRPVYRLDVPDDYAYRDPVLEKLIAERYKEVVIAEKG